MRRAFVVQFNRESTADHYNGRIEHVDTGRARHFDSIDEALTFVHQVLADTEQEEHDQPLFEKEGNNFDVEPPA